MNRDALKPATPLFPAREDREHCDDFLTRELVDAQERIAQGCVMPASDRSAFQRELAAFDFQNPRALEEVLKWTIAGMEHGLVHVTHPRYFGLFNPDPAFPAQCADRISGIFQSATRDCDNVAGRSRN